MTLKADRERRNFYRSWDWMQLRYETIRRYGARCLACGDTPATGARITVDHIRPIRFHWNLRLDPNNVQVLCDRCNRGKSCTDTTDWRPRAYRPRKPFKSVPAISADILEGLFDE